MSNFRKIISVSAVAMLGVTNLLTPLSYANAATWYDSLTNNDLESPALSFIMPDHNVSLYARTAANKYFVIYSWNTHTSGTMWSGTFTYDETGTLAPNAFVKTWYTWGAWNKQADGGGTSYGAEADVFNWTTVENDEIPIYAQWIANHYNIIYNLNKGDGTTEPQSGASAPLSLTYDVTWTIDNPTRVWYSFAGWNISGMDGESHIVRWNTSTETSGTGVMGTEFKNLNANSGANVTFLATWDREKVDYKVNHYQQDLDWNYPTIKETDNLSGYADTEVMPDAKTYDWFTPNPANTPKTGSIAADGSTVFTYQYTRNSYDLGLIAGRWVDSVTATGTVNTAGITTSDNLTGSFKYEEPIKLSYVLKDWYENETWSGYSGTADSFTMPHEDVTKELNATPIVYNITYDPNGGTPSSNPATYTVETSGFTLNNPTGTHSTFQWWTGWVIGGTQLAETTLTVTIPYQSTWHRSYTAVWQCDSWYHPSDDREGDNYWNCVADGDTDYTVKHYFQNVEWSSYVYSGSADELKSGVTDTVTTETGNVYPWFVVNHVDQTVINWNGTWVAKVYYDRLSYSWNITTDTWVLTAEWDGANSPTGWPYKYEDTVTLTATTWAGYIFDGWTVTDENSAPVAVTNASWLTATFVMPVWEVAIHAAAHTDTYTITYYLNSWTVAWINPEEYTVETLNIILTDPTRDHSVFLWWTWTDHSELFSWTVVAVSQWSIWDREFVANWWCMPWYHADWNSCVANEYHIVVPNMNWTGHWAPDNINFTYDQTWSLPEAPSQSWYDFVWWSITWMSGWVEHYIGDVVVSEDDTYVYSGTSIEFKNLTVESGGIVTLTALWSPRNDTDYVVYHYLKDVNEDTYTLSWTVPYTWTTDTDAIFSQLTGTFEWFTYSGWYVNVAGDPATRPAWAWVTTGNIEKDGSLKIYLYYDRNIHTVTLSGDEHVASLSWTWSRMFEFWDIVNVSATPKTWYHFVRWDASPAPTGL